jgi:hypothetical protein
MGFFAAYKGRYTDSTLYGVGITAVSPYRDTQYVT